MEPQQPNINVSYYSAQDKVTVEKIHLGIDLTPKVELRAETQRLSNDDLKYKD